VPAPDVSIDAAQVTAAAIRCIHSMRSIREKEFPDPSKKFPVPRKKFPVISGTGNLLQHTEIAARIDVESARIAY
jgi:hypothetical protein